MTTYNFKSLLMVSVLIITFASCGKQKTSETATEAESLPEDIVELREDQAKLANVEMGAIELRTMSGTLKVTGTLSVAPQNLASVSMPMGGAIKSTNLIPGNAVRKGQTLAVIENMDFIDIQQNYLEAKNSLELARTEYERQSELYKSDVTSQKIMQQVSLTYNNLKVQCKALEQKLSLIGINPLKLNQDNISRSVALVSPISGYIKTVNVSIGKSVSASDVLFEIVNSDKLFLELTLFEKDADKVSNGDKIDFYINNETEPHKALIYQTGKSINNDKSFKVYANVVGRCANLLPGMYVNAVIQAKSNQVTSVPTASIVSFEDKDYIFVFEKNKKEEGKAFTEYRMIQIQKGISDNGYTEIVLPEGFNFKAAKLVVKGAYNLLSAKKNAGEMAC